MTMPVCSKLYMLICIKTVQASQTLEFTEKKKKKKKKKIKNKKKF